MKKDEIISMLKERAQRKELEYEVYADYLTYPSVEKRKALTTFIEKKFGGTGELAALGEAAGEGDDKDD